MPKLKNIKGDELVYIAATIAALISKDLDNDELITLSDMLSAISSSLNVIIAQNVIAENRQNEQSTSSSNKNSFDGLK